LTISELRDQLVAPIAGESPLGGNINYEMDFDALKTEIGKPGNIDYELVETLAKKISKDKSKDLRVFSFLSLVYLRDEKWDSFADVFDVAAQLAVQNFEGLFPDRPRAKFLAFKWLSEPRYTDTLAQKKPQEKDYEDIVRLIGSLDKLKPVLEKGFPEGSPFPANIYSAAVAWEKACKPKPKAEAPAPGSAAPVETPKDAQAAVRKAALFLIAQEPQRPMGYRLLRAARWDLLEKSPPITDGKTQLSPPNEQQRAYFVNLMAQKDWKTCLQKAEEAFVGGANHLWLDLQRISATACRELGETHKAVRDAILYETAAFIRRLPDLAGLQFSDGSLLCDPATKEWLASEVKAVFSPTDGGAAQSTAQGDDPLTKEKAEVNARVAAGQVEQALELLQDAMSTSKSERDNFFRSIMVGNLLLKGKQADVAVSFLESLNETIDKYKLDRWDPDLAVEGWTAMVSAYKAAKAGKAGPALASITEKHDAILSKISRINPRKAFLLNK
jgi:type VI secretion system protein VasJ